MPFEQRPATDWRTVCRLPALLLCLVLSGPDSKAQPPEQSPADPLGREALDWIGERIYDNECRRRRECLLSWNAGEDFPSLGIGHFIWYRNGQQAPYTETFPALLHYLQDRGIALPAWLEENGYRHNWPDRESFLAARDETRLRSLQALLERTMAEQAGFILQRFRQGLESLLAGLDPLERENLEHKINNILAAEPVYGAYALIDYVHFKGEGDNPAERYRGEGWGLLQVLQGMPVDSASPLEDFVTAADATLTRRVDNAPAQRNESRWLAGWRNRLQTYLPPSDPRPD